MIEVEMNFNEMKVTPIGVKSVEIDGVALNETCEVIKDMRCERSTITIDNAFSVNFKPSESKKVDIHITSVYKSVDGEIITVHERSVGYITNVLNKYGNTPECPSSYTITIENVNNFTYTMEVMTDIEKVQDDMGKMAKSLEKEIKDLKSENEELRTLVDKHINTAETYKRILGGIFANQKQQEGAITFCDKGK